MAKFAYFTKAREDRPTRPDGSSYSLAGGPYHDTDGEDDGIAQEAQTNVVPIADQPIEAAPDPVGLAVDEIRSFYPRTRGRVGTRIVLKGGAAYPVQESFNEVRQMLAGLRD